MSHIFISYSHANSTEMAQVRDLLRSEGLPVWTDERLTPGTLSWKNAIEDALNRAVAVVVLLSPEARQSESVEREMAYSLLHDVPIYPLLIGGDEALSKFPRIEHISHIDARDNPLNAAQPVIDQLCTRLGTERLSMQRARAIEEGTRKPLDGQLSSETLGRIFNFDQHTLVRNRDGYITAAQRTTILTKLIGFTVMGIMGGAMLVSLAVQFLLLIVTGIAEAADATTGGYLLGDAIYFCGLGIPALAVVGFGLWLLINSWLALLRKARHVEGTMIRVAEKRSPQILVGETTLSIPRKAWKLLDDVHFGRFRVYYWTTGISNHVLSIEPWNEVIL